MKNLKSIWDNDDYFVQLVERCCAGEKINLNKDFFGFDFWIRYFFADKRIGGFCFRYSGWPETKTIRHRICWVVLSRGGGYELKEKDVENDLICCSFKVVLSFKGTPERYVATKSSSTFFGFTPTEFTKINATSTEEINLQSTAVLLRDFLFKCVRNVKQIPYEQLVREISGDATPPQS
jgi:hypothetical protein